MLSFFTIFCCFYCVPSFYLLSSFEYITQLKGWAVCLKWSTNIQQQKFALSRDCLWCPYNSFVTFVKMNQFKNYLPIFFFLLNEMVLRTIGENATCFKNSKSLLCIHLASSWIPVSLNSQYSRRSSYFTCNLIFLKKFKITLST